MYEEDGFTIDTVRKDYLVTAYIEDAVINSSPNIFMAQPDGDMVCDDWSLFNEGIDCADEEYAGYIREYLSGRGLSVNPQKEVFSSPEEGWSFLGFSYRRGTVDISSVTVKKIKAKMRRKSRALLRWRERNNISGEKAAAAFIRIFRRKLLESPKDNELSWSFWFFSVINTADSLREIDRYAVDCIRYIITGTRRKSRFRVGYEDIKKLGFVSLVNSYYGDKLNRE